MRGRGTSSRTDSVIRRDRDANSGWGNAADGTLEERRFYAQNWRADVVAITNASGEPIEWVRYSSYGEPVCYPVADVNRDGVVNATDATDWNNLAGGGSSNAALPLDLNFDGIENDPTDGEFFTASYNANTSFNGKTSASTAGMANRKLYAGYEWDPALQAFHVRHRVLVPELGRWTRRDPLGYVDGMSVYEYSSSRPTMFTDASGLSFFLWGPWTPENHFMQLHGNHILHYYGVGFEYANPQNLPPCGNILSGGGSGWIVQVVSSIAGEIPCYGPIPPNPPESRERFAEAWRFDNRGRISIPGMNPQPRRILDHYRHAFQLQRVGAADSSSVSAISTGEFRVYCDSDLPNNNTHPRTWRPQRDLPSGLLPAIRLPRETNPDWWDRHRYVLGRRGMTSIVSFCGPVHYPYGAGQVSLDDARHSVYFP